VWKKGERWGRDGGEVVDSIYEHWKRWERKT